MKRLCMLLLALLLANSAFAAIFQVMVADFQFTPANLTIQQGDTVVWSNMGGFHNVHHSCEPSVFGNVPALNPWTYRFVFNVPPGEYPYICEIHPDMMQGSITVERRGRWNVSVRNFSFTPQNLIISQGDTVVWSNTQGTHNVHHNATPSLFGNNIGAAPWTYSFIFNVPPDSFPYICQVHPSLMTGSVKVLGPMPVANPASLVIQPEDGQLHLYWEAVCGATEYAVYRSINASTTPFTELAGTTTATDFITPLDPVIPVRFYEVRAVLP